MQRDHPAQGLTAAPPHAPSAGTSAPARPPWQEWRGLFAPSRPVVGCSPGVPVRRRLAVGKTVILLTPPLHPCNNTILLKHPPKGNAGGSRLAFSSTAAAARAIAIAPAAIEVRVAQRQDQQRLERSGTVKTAHAPSASLLKRRAE